MFYFIEMSAASRQKPVVSCALMGGLGNQLFQIFTTLAYSIKNNFRAAFQDVPTLYVGRPRPTYWDTFLPELRAAGAIGGILSCNTYYSEKTYNYVPIPPAAASANGVMLSGYFQSYKYFIEELPAILDLLRIREKQREILVRVFGVSSPPVIGIHFRAGDYLLKPAYHPVLGAEYYKRALDFVVRNCDDGAAAETVLWFAEPDSKEHAGAIVAELGAAYPDIMFIEIDDSMADWEQLLMMSLCKHLVIANSSFSWWGAFLGAGAAEKKGGIICYPSRWFGPDFRAGTTADLFPAWWHKIDV